MCHGLERVYGQLHECAYSELMSTIKSGCTKCSQNSARVRLEYIWMLYMPLIGYIDLLHGYMLGWAGVMLSNSTSVGENNYMWLI